MAQLNVDTSDLLGAADTYTALAARTALLSQQAAVEAQHIADTHGPMGYPAAVGIATGLADPQARLEAKVTDFQTHAQRFSEHAATYIDEDHEAARRIKATNSPIPYGQSTITPLNSDIRVDGGGVVIIWCTPTPSGFRCTNLFPDRSVVVYPSPTDRTGAWLP